MVKQNVRNLKQIWTGAQPNDNTIMSKRHHLSENGINQRHARQVLSSYHLCLQVKIIYRGLLLML
jgi:truncated hemoglobin YjbI